LTGTRSATLQGRLMRISLQSIHFGIAEYACGGVHSAKAAPQSGGGAGGSIPTPWPSQPGVGPTRWPHHDL